METLIQKRQILPTQFCISAFKFFAGTKEDAGTMCMLDPEVTFKVDILGSQDQIFVTVELFLEDQFNINGGIT